MKVSSWYSNVKFIFELVKVQCVRIWPPVKGFSNNRGQHISTVTTSCCSLYSLLKLYKAVVSYLAQWELQQVALLAGGVYPDREDPGRQGKQHPGDSQRLWPGLWLWRRWRHRRPDRKAVRGRSLITSNVFFCELSVYFCQTRAGDCCNSWKTVQVSFILLMKSVYNQLT